MNSNSVVHYFLHNEEFSIPQYCRPLMSPRYATLVREEVTCKACLTKMRRSHLIPGAVSSEERR